MEPVRIRYSERMERALSCFAAESGYLSKPKSIEFVILRYLRTPTVYSELSAFELREPTVKQLSVDLSDEVYRLIADFSTSHNITISSAIRMAIYQELICHETKTRTDSGGADT